MAEENSKPVFGPRELGKSGVKVSPIGLGAMPLSVEGRPHEKQAIQVIHAALDAGTNFIDTADVYCLDNNELGHNERIIRKALAERGNPPEVVVASKGGCSRPGGRWETKGSPSHLRAACEASLLALGVECIALYQLHTPDPRIPFSESIGELVRLKDEGKINLIGLSNVTAKHLETALEITEITSIQNRFSPIFRHDLDNGLIALCAKHQITYIAHSPTGGFVNHREFTSNRALKAFSDKYHVSPYCVLLAWQLSKSPNIIPIPGASKVTSASDSPKARFVELAPEDIKVIDNL